MLDFSGSVAKLNNKGTSRDTVREFVAKKHICCSASTNIEGSMSTNSDNNIQQSFEVPTNSPEQKLPAPATATENPHRPSPELCFRDFTLIRQIGAGDIGRVFLCRRRSSGGGDEAEESRLYAMKVVDNEVLALKKKIERAETERKIMRMLDHPFLPRLFAEFEDSNCCCVVMEYCCGGDLHALRDKQPHQRFSINAARFYAAEVLIALEYLHMLGIIYRDLKPENVLVRSDGHIMLTDFDLSLCSNAIIAVESPDFSTELSSTSTTSMCQNSRTRTTPFSCISNRLFRSKKIQTLSTNRTFVAEPVTARSYSFVGTHEYVSPEVASGGSHGNAVDWWSLGIFIYEMIYGTTPFAGASNEDTLRNIINKPLCFPNDAPSSAREMHARGLISKLLNKDPNKRLGSKRGAGDVKKDPFFKGLNFALIRSVMPPSARQIRRQKTRASCQHTAPFDIF